jgi:medium-chain acyl-[acyl-carrier-protein] hydrolase
MNDTKSDLILRLESRIPAYYVSFNGQPKFYTLAGMLLESAAAHADMYGFGYRDMLRDKVYWVLSRFHVIMHSYPRMNDPVVIETWHKGPNRIFFARDYRMLSENGRLLASATTAWLVLDVNTGRPRKVHSDNSLFRFVVSDLHAIENLPDKLPSISEPDRQLPVTARYSDLDINRHVNAVKYIEWIQDCYDEKLYESKNIREFQINYQLETRFGEQLEIRIKTRTANDPFDYFEGIRIADQNLAFQARISFGEFD